MDAIISGRAGRVLLIDKDEFLSFGPNSLPQPLDPNTLSGELLFGDANDLLTLTDTTIEHARRALNYEYRCAIALDLALISLDSTLSQTTRRRAIEVLENELIDHAVRRRVEHILYGRALPRSADVEGALKQAGECRAVEASTLLNHLWNNQPKIRMVQAAWDSAIKGLELDKATTFDLIVREGLFHYLVSSFEDESKMKDAWSNLVDDISTFAAIHKIKEGLETFELDRHAPEGLLAKPIGKKPPRSETKGSISTSCLSIDITIGVGGVPRGRIVEIYGPESSGKTTIALHTAAAAQLEGGVAAYIDAEQKLDAVYAERLGVNVDHLIVAQPESTEQAMAITEELIRSGGIDLIIVDSLASLMPSSELRGETAESISGSQSRWVSQTMRKLTALVSQSNSCIIFINEMSGRLGSIFGHPQVSTGGRALRFYSSVRLDMRRIGPIREDDRVVGSRIKVKVTKNKMSMLLRECEFDMIIGEGIAREADILDLATTNHIVKQTGEWFSYDDERLGKGRHHAINTLKERPELLHSIENKLRTALADRLTMPEHEGWGGLMISRRLAKKSGGSEERVIVRDTTIH